MMNGKTLSRVIVGLVIVFMAGAIISLLDTNYELSTKLSETEQNFNELNIKYDKLDDECNEVSDEYETLVKGIHNKFEGNEYEIEYRYEDRTYKYEGNGKLFGDSKIVIY